ncbi:hypothetical protein D3C73_892550 [compost metagenome]
MCVVQAPQYLGRIDGLAAVEGHHQRSIAGQPLQQVHAIADRAGRGRIARHMCIPGCPGLTVGRQQRGIGVQHSLVGLVADGTQHRPLNRVGIRQQRQGLVTVAGQDHFIEAFNAGRGVHARAPWHALDRVHRAFQPFVHPPACTQRVHIAGRAALDHAPGRAPGHLQHLVIGHELHQIARRKVQHLCGR